MVGSVHITIHIGFQARHLLIWESWLVLTVVAAVVVVVVAAAAAAAAAAVAVAVAVASSWSPQEYMMDCSARAHALELGSIFVSNIMSAKF